jgi:hypothetical protein
VTDCGAPDDAARPAHRSEQPQTDEHDLRIALRGLSRLVAGSGAMDELLAQVAVCAARALPGVAGAGVSVIDSGDGRVRSYVWAATAQFVTDLDVLQYETLAEGPGMASMGMRRATVSGAIGSDSRWPRFGAQVAQQGIHSVLALPLLVADRIVGVISAYACRLDAFGEYAVRIGERFARPAAVSVYNAQLLHETRRHADELQRTLGSRALIDQAIGIMRSQTGGSAEEAFDELRRISQSENLELAQIARNVVDQAVERAVLQQKALRSAVRDLSADI